MKRVNSMGRGRIPQELFDQVIQKSDVVDVIIVYVQLSKAGKNYKGLCPFHGENTPSFVVSPALLHCFTISFIVGDFSSTPSFVGYSFHLASFSLILQLCSILCKLIHFHLLFSIMKSNFSLPLQHKEKSNHHKLVQS